MKTRTLCNIMQLGFSALMAMAIFSSCNHDDSVAKSSKGGITIIQENFGSQTRSGLSPILHQETIHLGDGIYMDVTLQEDFGPAELEDAKTRADIKAGDYTILAYDKDNKFVGADKGKVVYDSDGVGTYTSYDETVFSSGQYKFICVRNVDLSPSYDLAYVTRGELAENDANVALISDVATETITDGDIDIQFTMRHKESAIRFSLQSPGAFSGVKAVISTSTLKPSKHEYALPSITLNTSNIETSKLKDDIIENITGGSQTTPYKIGRASCRERSCQYE